MFANRPDRITLDAFSDSQIDFGNGSYNTFTNRLQTPILNAKGVQLLSANLVNTSLQLNDLAHLTFWYYASTTQAGIATAANLRCVRLFPSNYVPYSSFTSGYTMNQYFNSVSELVAQLNVASSTGGDTLTYNPFWLANGITFSYNSSTRRISVSAGTASYYIAPAAVDDPLVQSALAGTASKGVIQMLTAAGASAINQPYSLAVSMNSRLGFGIGYYGKGQWSNGSSQLGCATSTGVPTLYGSSIMADQFPILLGSQNVNIYLDIVAGGGLDSYTGKNLLSSIPISAPALNVIAYTTSGIRVPTISVPNEIYSIQVYLRDDQGLVYNVPSGYNVEVALAVFY